MDNVPVLDLDSSQQEQIRILDYALRNYGFFYCKNHSMDLDIEKQFDAAKELFDLSVEEKNSMPFNAQLDIGYVGPHGQNLDAHDKNTTTDTKEQFMQTNHILITTTGSKEEEKSVAIDPTNVFKGSQNYKPNVPNYAQITNEYASKAYMLNQKLNNILFEALELDDDMKEQLGSQPFIVLKQMKYAGEPSDPTKGKYGAGAHCDWGSFTILATDQTPGLQIYLPIKQQWLPVPPKPNCFIINSGDQIAQLTNDMYRSALHRVVTTSTKPRYSTAVFTYFGISTPVGPLPKLVQQQQQGEAKYPHRTTLEYFHYKLHESFGVTATTTTTTA